MDYLAYRLIWWLLVAFAIGLIIGWVSCSRTTGGHADR
jgi:hypothetical protein